METIAKVWGTRTRIFANKNIAVDFLNLKKNSHCSFHVHKNKYNRFYVLSGQLDLIIDNQNIILHPKQEIDILPNQVHQFKLISDCTVIEISWNPKGELKESDIIRFVKGGISFDQIKQYQQDIRRIK